MASDVRRPPFVIRHSSFVTSFVISSSVSRQSSEVLETPMFRTIADFEASWKIETEATQKILKALTDASLAQRVTPDGRTLGKLGWHIVQSVPEMLTTAKLPLGYTGSEPPIPTHASEFVTAWEQLSPAALDAVKSHWSDAALLEEIEMYGEKWTRGLTLSILV